MEYTVEEAKERSNLAHQNLHYSTQRIDLLVVSICGAGIYVCLETLKFLAEQKMEVSNWSLKTAGILLILAIICNFISQFTGRKANHYDYLMCLCIIKENNKSASKNDRLSSKWDMATDWFNHSSMIAMFIGLIMILLFFVFI